MGFVDCWAALGRPGPISTCRFSDIMMMKIIIIMIMMMTMIIIHMIMKTGEDNLKEHDNDG